MTLHAPAAVIVAVALVAGCVYDATSDPDVAETADWNATGPEATTMADQWCLQAGICTIAGEVGYQLGDATTPGAFNAPELGQRTGFAIHNATDSQQLAMIQYEVCGGVTASDAVLLDPGDAWVAHVDEVVDPPGPCGGPLRLSLLDGNVAMLGHAFVSYTTDGGVSYRVYAPATGQTFNWP